MAVVKKIVGLQPGNSDSSCVDFFGTDYLQLSVLHSPNKISPMVFDDKYYLLCELYIANFTDFSYLITDIIVKISDVSIRLDLEKAIISGTTTINSKTNIIVDVTVSVNKKELCNSDKMMIKIIGKNLNVTTTKQPYINVSIPIDVCFTQIPLSSPVGKGQWYVFGSPLGEQHHRKTLYNINNKFYDTERYATDLFIVIDNSTYKGDPSKNTSYYCYGKKIYAPYCGKIIKVIDGIPDNNGTNGPIIPITSETITGNLVVIDIGCSKYIAMGHMIPGSIVHKTGDYVHKGDVLGQIGNSGCSYGAHLHIQMTDNQNYLFSNGIPYVYEQFIFSNNVHKCEYTANDGQYYFL